MSRGWFSAIMILLGSMMLDPSLGNPSETGATFDAEVAEFVARGYPHGVPYGEARRLGPRAVPRLATLLEDEKSKPHWRSIVQTLNYSGSPEAFPVLKRFILNRFGDDIDVSTVHAIGSAINTMGPLARVSPEAMEFLRRGARSGGWTEVRWTSSSRFQGGERDRYLTLRCLNALASSGTMEADREFQELMTSGARHPFWPAIEPFLQEMRVANRDIIAEGFENNRRRRDEFYREVGGKSK